MPYLVRGNITSILCITAKNCCSDWWVIDLIDPDVVLLISRTGVAVNVSYISFEVCPKKNIECNCVKIIM